MTTSNPEFAIYYRLAEEYRTDRRKAGIHSLPAFEVFEEKFRRAFGREMTREERRFYRLANIVLEEDTADTNGRAAPE